MLAMGTLTLLPRSGLRRTWHGLALCNTGLVLWLIAARGSGWEDLNRLLLIRAVALHAVALALGWLPARITPGNGVQRPATSLLLLVAFAALVGLPLTSGWAAWRRVLWDGAGLNLTAQGWTVALVGATLWTAGAAWWRTLQGLILDRPISPAQGRETPLQTLVALLVALAVLISGFLVGA